MYYNIKENLQNTNARLLTTRSLFTAVIGIIFGCSIAQANAELIIEPSTQSTIIVSKADAITQTDTSQKYNAVLTNSQLINTQAATESSIIRLMQVMHIDKQIAVIANGQKMIIDDINMQAGTQNKQSNGYKLNKSQRELQTQIQSVLGQYAKIMSSSIGDATNVETMTQAYINAAKDYYSQAEVDAQIKFYDTTMGQSILAKQPQITAAFLKQSLPEGINIDDTKNQLSELLPQMKKIFKDIL